MKKLSVFTVALIALTLSRLALAAPMAPPGKYEIDVAHAKVGFEVSHLVISTVEGRFNTFSGDIVVADKAEDSQVNVTIDASSIDTGQAKRDEHLRAPDFFDVKKYPTITFKSKKVSVKGSDLKVVGDLTMHGVTKEVALDGKYLGSINDPMFGQKISIQSATKINRKDFGLTWNKLLEAGPAVGDEVTISIKFEANRVEPKK